MSIQLFSVNKEVTPEHIADAISHFSDQIHAIHTALTYYTLNHSDSERMLICDLLLAENTLLEQLRLLNERDEALDFERIISAEKPLPFMGRARVAFKWVFGGVS